MIEFKEQKKEVASYHSQVSEIISLMEALENLYSQGTSRLLRAKIRKLKHQVTQLQKVCLEKDKDYLDSLAPEVRSKRGRKIGQKNGEANPK